MPSSENTPPIDLPDKTCLLYYITDRTQIPQGNLLACIRKNLNHGIDILQIREKDLSDGDLYRLTIRIREMAQKKGCKVIVNGRADIALAAGADGVHLPSTGLTVEDLRSSIPPGFIIGVSCHSLKEAGKAAESGAGYITFGPIFPTPSKLKFGDPVGLNALRQVCRSIHIPVFGLGGISAEKIPSVLQAGAAGIAGISLFQNSGARGSWLQSFIHVGETMALFERKCKF